MSSITAQADGQDRRTFYCRQDGYDKREHDAWFVGFTYLVTGVYVGYDQIQSLGAWNRAAARQRRFSAIIAQMRVSIRLMILSRRKALPWQGNLASGRICRWKAHRRSAAAMFPQQTDNHRQFPACLQPRITSGKRRSIMRQMF